MLKFRCSCECRGGLWLWVYGDDQGYILDSERKDSIGPVMFRLKHREYILQDHKTTEVVCKANPQHKTCYLNSRLHQQPPGAVYRSLSFLLQIIHCSAQWDVLHHFPGCTLCTLFSLRLFAHYLLFDTCCLSNVSPRSVFSCPMFTDHLCLNRRQIPMSHRRPGNKVFRSRFPAVSLNKIACQYSSASVMYVIACARIRC